MRNMKEQILKAIGDLVDPFAAVSALKKRVIDAEANVETRFRNTNQFVDVLGERDVLAAYLTNILKNPGSFVGLLKANQERLTCLIYGHAQLRVTSDLKTVIGVWVPHNIDVSAQPPARVPEICGGMTGDILPLESFRQLEAAGWSPTGKVAIEPPHSHHFDFSSKVVSGQFHQATYRRVKTARRQSLPDESAKAADGTDPPAARQCAGEDVNAGAASQAGTCCHRWHGMRKVGWAWPAHVDRNEVSDLECNGAITMNEGDVYQCPMDLIHTVILPEEEVGVRRKPLMSLHCHSFDYDDTAIPWFYITGMIRCCLLQSYCLLECEKNSDNRHHSYHLSIVQI